MQGVFDLLKPLQWTMLSLALLLTAACSSRENLGQLTPVARANPLATKRTILVATTRLPADDPTSFTAGRSFTPNYQRIALSIPPNHRTGAIEAAARGPGNVDTQFAALENSRLSQQQFATLASQAAAAGGGEITLFVHGYNTTHAEAVLALGQISHDAGSLGASIVFSWPSRGQVLDYLADRESAIFSRDHLESTLRLLARQSGVRRINLLAHSTGAFLAMETLRQAKLRGDGEFSGKLNAVVLASPDIDIDVFRTQLAVIGKRPRPTVLLVSSDDRVLAFATFLYGGVERVGGVAVNSVEAQNEIARLGLIVIDLQKVEINDASSHNKFAAVPRIVRHVGNLVNERRSGSGGSIQNLDSAADPIKDSGR